MKPIFAIFLLAITVAIGCDSNTGTSAVETTPKNPTSMPASKSANNADDPAKYAFHPGVAFTDITKNMPDGSVDHIDFNMAADPNVVVVVTVSVPHKDGIQFTTTFTGSNDLAITKEWQPAAGDNTDDQYIGLFVLPAAVDAGTTIVNSEAK